MLLKPTCIAEVALNSISMRENSKRHSKEFNCSIVVPVPTKLVYGISPQDGVRFFQTGKDIAFLIVRAPVPAPELSKSGDVVVNGIGVKVIR